MVLAGIDVLLGNSEPPGYSVYAVWEPTEMIRIEDVLRKFEDYAQAVEIERLEKKEDRITVRATCKISEEKEGIMGCMIVIGKNFIFSPEIPEVILMTAMLQLFHDIKSVARNFSVIVKSNYGDGIAISV